MNYRAQITNIRAEYQNGFITHEQAKQRILPLLDEMNKKGQAIARKFGRKFNKLTFGYVFR